MTWIDEAVASVVEDMEKLLFHRQGEFKHYYGPHPQGIPFQLRQN